jgi:5-formyltetrahydrofolate cyclo-ligase
MVDKTTIRQQMLTARAALPAAQKQMLDQAICLKLWLWTLENQPQTIHTYLPMGNEVDIRPFIKQALQAGITLVAPKSLKGRQLEHLVLRSMDELEPGIFGTVHPAGGQVYNGAYDLFVIPGLAFDAQGGRLGYGAGYYDIFLQNQPTGLKAGVCYPFQLVREIPLEPHDVPMDVVWIG